MAESDNKRKSSSSSGALQEEESSSSCEGATGRDQETSGSDDFDDLEELPSTVEQKFTRHNSRVSIDSISLSENGGLDFICVRRLAKSSAFRRKKSLEKDKQSKKSRDGARNKKRKRFWSFRFKKRLQGQLQRPCDMPVSETSVTSDGPSCVCTEIRRTDDHLLGPGIVFSATKSAQRRISDAQGSGNNSPVSERRTTTSPKADISHAELLQLVVPVPPERPCSSRSSGDDMDPFADIDEILATRRKQEIKEGIELSDAELQRFYPMTGGSGTPPSYPATMGATGGTSNDSVAVLANNLQARCNVKTVLHRGLTVTSDNSFNPYKCVLPQNLNPYPHRVHTQVDYIHCLVPDLQDITSCAFYWGVMDRYEAERLLEGKPQGTFLLRDSAQEEFLFSVSFRRYGRSLHARIEQWNHKFSFDSHDPGVFASDTVCGLIEHYKDPSCCMFFEPMLTIPLPRKFPFTLQHMCRSVISNQVSYDGIHYLPLPRSLKDYLKYYHYKQKVRVRRFELPH